MWKDPIIEKIHLIREEIAKESNYNLHEIFKKLRNTEKHTELKIKPVQNK